MFKSHQFRRVAAGALVASALALAFNPGAFADETWINEKPVFPEPIGFTFFHEGDSITYRIPMFGDKPAIGFLFEGFYKDDGPGAPTFWASDLQLIITPPNGNPVTVGGFNTPNDEDWDFQGMAASDMTGYYTSDHFPWKDDPKDKEGIWTVTLRADFNGVPGPMRWANVQLTLYNVPAPGVLALLGLVGLMGRRRRRR